MKHSKAKWVGSSAIMVGLALAVSSPAFAATPYYPLYYTASYGGTLYRQHAPFTLESEGISQTNTTSGNGTTVTLKDSGKTGSTGFVVEGGPLGTLATKSLSGDQGLSMFQVKGTGTFQVDLWIDSNTANDSTTNGDRFSWRGPLSSTVPSSMSSEGSDQLLIGPSGTGPFTLNGHTLFLDTANSTTYTLNDLQKGDAPSITGSDNVAVWVGIKANASGPAATITGVKINSTAVPLGQLPEVPYAAGIPLMAGTVILGGVLWQKHTRHTELGNRPIS
jgi:hypothetical protein